MSLSKRPAVSPPPANTDPVNDKVAAGVVVEIEFPAVPPRSAKNATVVAEVRPLEPTSAFICVPNPYVVPSVPRRVTASYKSCRESCAVPPIKTSFGTPPGL